MPALWWPATQDDMRALAGDMRPSDRYELAATASAAGRKPASVLDDLKKAQRLGDCWTLWWQHRIMGLAGVVPLSREAGAIWFLGTPEADARPVALTRASARFVAMQARRWRTLGNVLPRDMTERRRWLEKLGFDFCDLEANEEWRGFVLFRRTAPDGPEDGPAAP